MFLPNLRKLRLALASSLAALLTVVPAQAQMFVRNNVVTAEYGQCAARRDPEIARKIVHLGHASAEATRAFEQLIRDGDSCLRSSHLTLRRHLLRGAIAEHLLERDPVLSARLVRVLAQPPTRLGPVAADNFGDALARCVALAEPRRAVAVLATEMNSLPERQAMLALKPIVDLCLPRSGAQQMTIADLRSHLAAVLYQHAEALAPGAAEDR